MPQIVQQGSLNTTALIVPDLYVQIVPPQNLLINGVPTNVLGVVGTAQWGPVSQPMIVGNMAQYSQTFGAIQNRKYDMGTAVACAVLQGASNFRCVRVTDGTDVAAGGATNGVLAVGSLTLQALYTGTLGNSISATVSPGSLSSTFRIVIGVPGYQAEVFDSIPGTANAFWVNAANAINNGNSIFRGPSNFVTATSSAGVIVPLAQTVTLTGGLDGATMATTPDAKLIGVDTLAPARTGMYALRKQGCGIAMLADADGGALSASNTWSTQAAFGLSEGIYMVCTATAGMAIANGTTGVVDVKATAGLNSYAVKLMMGDWIYWQDPVNQVVRLVSPQGFAAGILANLSPEQSSLNKPLYGIIGTQKSGLIGSQNTTYANADLQLMIQNGIDVICNPQPSGAIWGCRAGHNSSSNPAINGDNYTRMTNYIASTLAAGMGVYVGMLINSGLFKRVTSTLMNFLNNLLISGQLGSTDGSLPYSVACSVANNPPSMTGLGYCTANVQVQYQAINEKFIVNLEGGQTVVVLTQSSLASGAASPA